MKRWSLVYKPNMIKGTDDTEKSETRLFSGTIRKINIDIPLGHNYSAGIRFEFTGVNGSDAVLPKRDQGSEIYYLGNDDNIKLSPNMEIIQGTIKILGANGDAVNDHEFVITIEVEELEKEIFD